MRRGVPSNKSVSMAAAITLVFVVLSSMVPSASAQSSREIVQQIREAYQASSNASTRADYEKIISILEEVLKNRLSANDKSYVTNLKGWAHNRRGESLIREGREAEALAEFNLAVELNARHWKSLHNRGVSLASQGELKGAIDDFTAALALKQDYANTWFNRGELHYELGDFDKAIADYGKAIAIDSEDSGFYNSRGHAYYRLRKFTESIADYDLAVQYDPENPASRVNRGDVHLELGNYEKSAADYMKAIELDANLGRAYQSAAWMMATCPVDRYRDGERAVVAAQKAMELDGADDYRYRETLATAYANAGEFDKAVELQQQVVEQAPKSDQGRCAALLKMFQQKQPYRLPEPAAKTAVRP